MSEAETQYSSLSSPPPEEARAVTSVSGETSPGRARQFQFSGSGDASADKVMNFIVSLAGKFPAHCQADFLAGVICGSFSLEPLATDTRLQPGNVFKALGYLFEKRMVQYQFSANKSVVHVWITTPVRRVSA